MSVNPRGRPLFKRSREHGSSKQLAPKPDRPPEVPAPAPQPLAPGPVLQVNTKRKNSYSPCGSTKRRRSSGDMALTELEMQGCLATGLISPVATVGDGAVAASSDPGPALGSSGDQFRTGKAMESQLLSDTAQWSTQYKAGASCLLSDSVVHTDSGGSGVGVSSGSCSSGQKVRKAAGSGSQSVLLTASMCCDDTFTGMASQAPLAASDNTHGTLSSLSGSADSQEGGTAAMTMPMHGGSGRSSPLLFDSEDVGGESSELQDGICPEEGDTSLSSSLLLTMLNDVTAELGDSNDTTGLFPKSSIMQSGLLSAEHSQEESNQVERAAASVPLLRNRPAAAQPAAPKAGFFGLPTKVSELFKSIRGIDRLYDWQTKCLDTALSGRRTNWIFSMPTSGGKTLVAEVLMFTEILINRKDALFIVPFVSIVQEKVRGLAPFAAELGFLVEEYAASQGRIPPRNRRRKQTLYIATIEKANSVITSLLEVGRLSSLGLVIIDELHMLGEGGSRGATLESSLSLLLHSSPDTWLVGMSATLSNIRQLQDFLSAQLFTSDFRPVKLVEYIMMNNELFEVQGSGPGLELVPHRKITASDRQRTDVSIDPDCFVPLVLHAIMDADKKPKHSCLVFCATKKSCQNVAAIIAKVFRKRHKSIMGYKSAERQGVLKTLRYESGGQCCPVLCGTVPAGVAYHHSGLTADERKVIEEAFSSDSLSVLCSTTTLAAGVNLPARRVILRCPMVGRSLVSLSQYKQMVGRAGRAGLDTTGDSILVLKDKDAQDMISVLQGPFASCESSLLCDGGKSFRRFLLSLIGVKVAASDDDLRHVIGKTLWRIQLSSETEFEAEIIANLQTLLKSGFIRRRALSDGQSAGRTDASLAAAAAESQSIAVPSSSCSVFSLPAASCQPEGTKYYYKATNLGLATMKGALDVSVAPIVYRDMLKSLRTISLSTDLHILYLVTPITETVNLEPDWMIYLREVTKLHPEEAHVASILGVTDAYLTQKATGRAVTSAKSAAQDMVYRRFYLTLLLHQLLKERSVWDVADMFSCSRGFVQNLMTSAASFASCLLHFTEGLKELHYVNILLPDIVRRLSFAVRSELLPLMEIPGIRQGRARQLHAAGLKTMQEVANCSVGDLLKKLAPISRTQVMQMRSAAKIALQEKAESLRDEADDLLAVSQPSQPTQS